MLAQASLNGHFQAPPKGTTIPFQPKPTWSKALVASAAQAAALQQQQLTTALLQQQMLQQANPMSVFSSEVRRLLPRSCCCCCLPHVQRAPLVECPSGSPCPLSSPLSPVVPLSPIFCFSCEMPPRYNRRTAERRPSSSPPWPKVVFDLSYSSFPIIIFSLSLSFPLFTSHTHTYTLHVASGPIRPPVATPPM